MIVLFLLPYSKSLLASLDDVRQSAYVQAFVVRLGSIAALAAFLVTASAAAADTTEVDMSSGVPDKALPLGKGFTIKVPVKKSSAAAYGVFIEYAHAAFAGRGDFEGGCQQIGEQLHVNLASLRTYKPGRGTVASTFDPKELSKELKTRPTLRLAPWIREAQSDEGKKAVTASLIVPASRFFKSGARYCFVAFQGFNRTLSAVAPIDKLAKRMARCGKIAAVACKKRVLADVDRLVNVTTQDATLKKAIKDALTPVFNLHHKKTNALELLANVQLSNPRALEPKQRSDGLPWLNLTIDALGDALDVALRSAGKDPRVNGKDLIALRVHGSKIRARYRVTTKKKFGKTSTSYEDVALDTKLSELSAIAGGSETPAELTFEDLRILATGRIPMEGKSPVTFDHIETLLSSIEVSNADAVGKKLAAIGKRVADIEKTIDYAVKHGPEKNLSDWLKAEFDTKQLAGLEAATEGASEPLGAWSKEQATIEQTLATAEIHINADVTVGLDTDTWFANFVVPTVGYVSTSVEASMPSIALQLYLFPNVTDEPMWSNGTDDFRRFFSLEVGISPDVDKLGPEERYSGIGDLPPFFVGVGLNIIPYTVLSGGMMMLEKRSSTLAEETATVTPVAYANFSVQANVPDIVRLLVKPKGAKKED